MHRHPPFTAARRRQSIEPTLHQSRTPQQLRQTRANLLRQAAAEFAGRLGRRRDDPAFRRRPIDIILKETGSPWRTR